MSNDITPDWNQMTILHVEEVPSAYIKRRADTESLVSKAIA